MSGRKNNLPAYKTINAASMGSADPVMSSVTNIEHLDNVGLQMVWTGAGEGTFTVEVSANHAQDYLGNVSVDGDWVALPLSPSPAAAGSDDSIYVDVNQISAPWIRATFTNTAVQSGQITTIGDTGSVAKSTIQYVDKATLSTSEYVVIYDTTGAAWAIAADLTGSDPAPTGAIWTAIPADHKDQVDLSAATDAQSVANAFNTAFGALTGFTDNTTLGTPTTGLVALEQIFIGPVTLPKSKTANDSGNGHQTITLTQAGAVSNLQSTYFLFDAYDGTQYYVWINVNGEGVDPAVPDRMPVEVTLDPGSGPNNSTDVATALGSQMDSDIVEITDVLESTNHVTFDQDGVGDGSMVDGAAPTGFTFDMTEQGTLIVFIVAKMI